MNIFNPAIFMQKLDLPLTANPPAPIGRTFPAAAATPWFHFLAVILASIAAGVLFIHEPGFGDELGYWSLAFDLHDIGGHAWSVNSFHDLRWPVWGVNWLWQACFGPGLASFYCTPILYLVAASLIIFAFGRLVLRSLGGAWACVISLWFIPELDAVISRPMPDLSECFYGTAALLAWWTMMQSEDRRRATIFGVISGLCIGLAFSNRITGIFITPVLAVATLVFFPRRWKWLFLPAAVAGLYVVAEGAVYHAVCGDWLHCIHANLGGRGAKDTVAMPLWRLPVRYLGGFFKGNRLASFYAVTSAIGLWGAWRRGAAGRLVVIWFAVLYLEYSCAVQSLHPVRPLIGSTFRYLAAFSFPMVILAIIGLIEIGGFLGSRFAPLREKLSALSKRPVVCAVVVIAILAAYTSRPLFNLGFTPEYSRHMSALPTGTKIFTHHAMRDLAFMVDPANARRLAWTAPSKILARIPGIEAEATACDEFWYLRKHMWLTYRKAEERSAEPQKQPALPSYLDQPERDWILNQVIMKADEPEMVFYRRRPAGIVPHILGPEAQEFAGLLPPLPVSWTAESYPKRLDQSWPVAASLRGQLVTFQFQVASPAVEPMIVKMRFTAGGKEPVEYGFRPIVYGGGGKEFLAVHIPANADKCWVQLNFNKGKQVTLSGFRAIFDDVR
jgi:hypothetical protein